MKIEQIVTELSGYQECIIAKLTEGHWQPYFLISELFSNNSIDDNFRNIFCTFYRVNPRLNHVQKDEFFRLLLLREKDLERILKSLLGLTRFSTFSPFPVLSFQRRLESRPLLHTLDSCFHRNDTKRVSPTYMRFQVTGIRISCF